MRKEKERKIQKGEIYYYDFGQNEGSIQSGRRPVLVIQADNFNAKAPTIIVAAITTAVKKQYLPSHIVPGENYGLSKPSMVLIEQIRTVNKSQLRDYVGVVNNEHIWKKINIAIKKTFGLWFYHQERTDDIRCLCPQCLQGYMGGTNYVVRRLDPFAKEREKCEKCENLGWEYIVYDKQSAIGRKR